MRRGALGGTAYLIVLTAACTTPARGQGTVSTGEIVFDSVVVAAAGPLLGIPVGSAVDEKGNLIIADMAGNGLRKFSPDGGLLWTVGEKGDGPGEFQLVYRVAATPGGNILALDFTRHDVSEFTADGEFLGRVRLPFRFTQIDAIAPLPEGRIAVVGITRWTEPPLKRSIHVFDEDLRHEASFGPTPPTEEEWVIERWGAGGASLAQNGEILFTQRIPHRVFRFTFRGELVSTTGEIVESEFGPDDAYVRERDGTATTYRTSGKPVLRPHPAHDVGHDWLLAGSVAGDDRRIDLVGPEGQVRRSFPMPPEWQSIVQVDPARGWLWVKGERNLEPIYFRASYRFRHPPEPRRSP
jgi:hypothetical protein